MSEINPPASPSYEEFVRKLFNRSKVGDLSKDFSHAILGIVTEIHEFLSATDFTNALEERGDLEFYVVALAQVCVDATNTVLLGSYEPGLLGLERESARYGVPAAISNEANDLLDIAKRWVGYDKPPAAPWEVYSRAQCLIRFVSVVGPFTVENNSPSIRAANMAKLLKRYPGGEFDSYRAIVRDLEAERVALQTA